jgi:hypothetical protein
MRKEVIEKQDIKGLDLDQDHLHPEVEVKVQIQEIREDVEDLTVEVILRIAIGI